MWVLAMTLIVILSPLKPDTLTTVTVLGHYDTYEECSFILATVKKGMEDSYPDDKDDMKLACTFIERKP